MKFKDSRSKFHEVMTFNSWSWIQHTVWKRRSNSPNDATTRPRRLDF